MSEQTIYGQFIAAGFTPVGACALMGNADLESGMLSNNAQNGMSQYTDETYTKLVDSGQLGFVRDSIGYGLFQWTFWSRKNGLLTLARSRGVSIADEAMQVDFAIQELNSDYAAVGNYLKTTEDLYEATRLVCYDYENPAVKNVDERYESAQKFYSRFAGTAPVLPSDLPEANVGKSLYNADMSVLCIGFDGTQLDTLRYILRAQGYDVAPTGPWEETFDEVIEQVQRDLGVTPDRIFGAKSFAALLSREPTAKATDSQKKTNILSKLIGKMSRKEKS